jgi:hypothetical protein
MYSGESSYPTTSYSFVAKGIGCLPIPHAKSSIFAPSETPNSLNILHNPSSEQWPFPSQIPALVKIILDD